MTNRITVEVIKLPAVRRSVSLFAGDTVERALFEALGEDNYSGVSISVNGDMATLRTPLQDGDTITISALIKGNRK